MVCSDKNVAFVQKHNSKQSILYFQVLAARFFILKICLLQSDRFLVYFHVKTLVSPYSTVSLFLLLPLLLNLN